MKYEIYVRNWWIKNSEWPNGLEPGPGPSTHIKHVDTIEEARDYCEEYNSTHKPGKLSRKAEFRSV
jgi:hypothetical protein